MRVEESKIRLLTFYSIDCVNASGKQVLGMVQIRAIQLLIAVAMILGIVGGTSTKPDEHGVITIPTTAKVAVILYLVAFLGIGLAFVLVLPHRTALDARERRIPIVLGLALPLILVRIVYSLIASLAGNKNFSIYHGSIGVRVGMAIAEEFIVVVMYVILGFTLQKLELVNRGELAHREWKLVGGRSRRRF